MLAFAIGFVMALAAILAALAAFGPRRAANFLTAFADALESVQADAVVTLRPKVVATLVADGYQASQASDAVGETAEGERTFHAWLRRARLHLEQGL